MQPIENKQQLVAAICAVIAEELGTESEKSEGSFLQKALILANLKLKK